jgi:diguanylate cyclase (GGDEF)-like protein
LALFGSIFLALLNPTIALVLAFAFAVLWSRHGETYVGAFAASYLAYAGSFLLHLFPIPFGEPGNAIVSNLLLAAALLAFSVGIACRYRARPPVAGQLLIAAAGLSAMLWFMFVKPDFTMRMYLVNFMAGGMLLRSALDIRAFAARKPVDTLLFAVVVLSGLTCLLRPIVGVWAFGPLSNRAELLASPIWTVVNFTSPLFVLLIAAIVIGAITAEMLEKLQRETGIDPLSGLSNRRGFEEAAENALQRSIAVGLPATLVLGDLDHFKSVNDRFGHICGDTVIAAFSRCLDQAARPGDIVARIGGEEFAVLLSAADRRTGRLFAESIRNACLALNVPGLPPDHRVTASFGVAESLPSDSLTTLLRRADAALYDAKRQGRDRVLDARDYRDGAPAGQPEAGPPPEKAAG